MVEVKEVMVGTSRLINGDCVAVMDELIKEGLKVDQVITDPPYNISQENNYTTLKGRQGIDFGEWDKDADLFSYMDRVYTLLKKGGNLIIFNDWKNLGDIARYGKHLGFEIKDMIRYEKANPAPFNKDRRYITDYEVAVWLVKGKKQWTFNRQADTYERPEFRCGLPRGKFHKTLKPVQLMEWLVKVHSNPGETILDCFMGSGSTGVAAIKNGRKFIGIELDGNYFQTAIGRIEGADQQSNRNMG